MRRSPSGEETVMLRSRIANVCHPRDHIAPSGLWSQSTSSCWVHTLSHRVSVTCITESTSVIAWLCITRDSHTAYAEGRWKKFLSLVSATATLSTSDPLHPLNSIQGR